MFASHVTSYPRGLLCLRKVLVSSLSKCPVHLTSVPIHYPYFLPFAMFLNTTCQYLTLSNTLSRAGFDSQQVQHFLFRHFLVSVPFCFVIDLYR